MIDNSRRSIQIQKMTESHYKFPSLSSSKWAKRNPLEVHEMIWQYRISVVTQELGLNKNIFQNIYNVRNWLVDHYQDEIPEHQWIVNKGLITTTIYINFKREEKSLATAFKLVWYDCLVDKDFKWLSS